MSRRLDLRFWLTATVLVALQFAVRPHLGDPRFAPDFLLLAFLLFAMRVRPAAGAAGGFLVGLANDALAPTAFGASALAHTIVGWLSGWVTGLLVADNIPVHTLFVFGAAWLRDVIQVLATNQLAGGALAWQLLVASPVAALATAVVAAAALLVTGTRGGR